MTKQEQINLTHQAIFAIIPHLNLYAFYRVQRLRIFLLISIAISLGSISAISVIDITTAFTEGVEFITEFESLMDFWKYIPIAIISYV